jgi:hypothetical protein
MPVAFNMLKRIIIIGFFSLLPLIIFKLINFGENVFIIYFFNKCLKNVIIGFNLIYFSPKVLNYF